MASHLNIKLFECTLKGSLDKRIICFSNSLSCQKVMLSRTTGNALVEHQAQLVELPVPSSKRACSPIRLSAPHQAVCSPIGLPAPPLDCPARLFWALTGCNEQLPGTAFLPLHHDYQW